MAGYAGSDRLGPAVPEFPPVAGPVEVAPAVFGLAQPQQPQAERGLSCSGFPQPMRLPRCRSANSSAAHCYLVGTLWMREAIGFAVVASQVQNAELNKARRRLHKRAEDCRGIRCCRRLRFTGSISLLDIRSFVYDSV